MHSPVPRRISLQATREFQKLFQEEFGVSLADDEAEQKAVELLTFFNLITKPDDNHSEMAR
jgi:hypothetical protein